MSILKNINQTNEEGKNIFEMATADVRMSGKECCVVNNNGAADLIIDGNPTQVKLGYEGNTPHWTEGYDTVVVDKGNHKLASKAEKAGYKVEESAVSKVDAEKLANAMRKESAITKSSTAPIISTVASAHKAGAKTASLTAKVAVPFKAGENLCDVLDGDKSVAAAPVLPVVAVAAGVGFVGRAVSKWF